MVPLYCSGSEYEALSSSMPASASYTNSEREHDITTLSSMRSAGDSRFSRFKPTMQMEANLNSAEQENLRITATFFKTFPKALACFTHAGIIIITGVGGGGGVTVWSEADSLCPYTS